MNTEETIRLSITRQIDNMLEDSRVNVETIDTMSGEIQGMERDLDLERTTLQDKVTVLLSLTLSQHRVFGDPINKVPLIRAHRAAYGLGLKESKDAVEDFLGLNDLGLIIPNIDDEDIPF